MKKIALLLACTTLVLGFTNCRNNRQTAGDAAREYAEKLNNGDCSSFVDNIYFEPGVHVDTVNAHKTAYVAAARKHVQKNAASKGGIKSIKVVSEQPIVPDKVTNVILQQDYNNGDSEKTELAMMLDETNTWKVRMGKNKEVWKVHYADGTKGTFKLKEDEHREIFKAHVDGDRDFVKAKTTDDKVVLKVKEDGVKDVVKVIEKDDEIVTKIKHDGHKEVIHEPKDEE